MPGTERKTRRSPRRVADFLQFNQLIGWDIFTDDKNDYVSASYADDSLIDLGTGNDTFAALAVGDVTIDGGTGTDTVSLLRYRQDELSYAYQGGAEWRITLSSAPEHSALLRNIEIITFRGGVTATLNTSPRAMARLTFTGTDKDNIIFLPVNTADPSGSFALGSMVNAGAGNDTIKVQSNWTTIPVTNTVDGGGGTDTLSFEMSSNNYQFEKSGKFWKVFDLLGHFIIKATGIDRAAFPDGTVIIFSSNGIDVTAGSEGLYMKGTAGNDTFRGSTEDDVFHTTAGTDFYDLSRGGSDIIYLNSNAYEDGTTNSLVTIKGFKRDDSLRFYPWQMGSIFADNTHYNADKFRIGDLIVSWDFDNRTRTTIRFTA